MIEFMNVGFFQIQYQHKFNNWDNDKYGLSPRKYGDLDDHKDEPSDVSQWLWAGKWERGEGCALGVDPYGKIAATF